LREVFKKKLAERLESTHVPSAPLAGYHLGRCKIKLCSVGYRLVYEVRESRVIVIVVAVGKRGFDDSSCLT